VNCRPALSGSAPWQLATGEDMPPSAFMSRTKEDWGLPRCVRDGDLLGWSHMSIRADDQRQFS
jgi:hypothetical protein